MCVCLCVFQSTVVWWTACLSTQLVISLSLHPVTLQWRSWTSLRGKCCTRCMGTRYRHIQVSKTKTLVFWNDPSVMELFNSSACFWREQKEYSNWEKTHRCCSFLSRDCACSLYSLCGWVQLKFGVDSYVCVISFVHIWLSEACVSTIPHFVCGVF